MMSWGNESCLFFLTTRFSEVCDVKKSAVLDKKQQQFLWNIKGSSLKRKCK